MDVVLMNYKIRLTVINKVIENPLKQTDLYPEKWK